MGYEVKELNAIAEMYQVLRRKLESLPQYPTGVNVANWLKSSAIACLELQRNVLGISVLGFIAIDLIDRKLVRLFDSGDVAEGFVLPFAWKREHESVDTDLLNYLFTTWRKQESIGREGQPLPRDAYPPEYVFHLCGDRRARSVSCGTDPRYSYAEIDMHYVSAGEVLFFLTAWRILLRSCVSRRKFGQSPSAVGGADASASGGTACIWEQIPVGMLSPRERFLLQSIKSLSNRRVLDAWKKTISRYDTFLPEPLGTLRDWEWLGIVSKDERKEHTWHFEPEFRHLVLFIQRFSAVPDLSRSVSALLENFQTGSLITESAGNQLIHLILDCFTALVGGQNDQRHTALAEPLLNRLHCFARFPVIPYFYWSVLDEDVKAHLAIPVAESPRRAIRVHGALDSEPEFSWTSYADTCESPPNKLSDTSCVALLGVRPLHCLEPTVERANLGTAKHFEADTLRLLCIRDYSSTLARPVIDEAVYGSVLFDSYQRHMFAAFTRRIHSAKTQVVSCKDRIQESLTLVRDLPKPSVMIALEKELEKAAKAIESSAGSLNFLLRRTGYRREKAEVVGPLVLRDIVEATKAAYKKLRIEILYEFPECTVFGNRDDIASIFEELLDNATDIAKGCDHFRVVISAQVVRKDQVWELPEIVRPKGIDLVLVTVEDNGPGVKKKFWEAIFSRGVSFGTRGSGHGLPRIRDVLYRPFVELSDMKGREILRDFSSHIWCDREQGARFRFFLPIDPLTTSD